MFTIRPRLVAWIAVLASSVLCAPLHAEVRLPAIFGDHMVLQRGLTVPFWGWAEPGEAVTVSIGDARASATAGPDGRWSLKLPVLIDPDRPVEVLVTGKNTIILHDVLIGDVWVCAGQSNMQLGTAAAGPRDEIAKANQPQIRLFCVPDQVAADRAGDLAAASPQVPLQRSWQVCTPDTVSRDGGWSGFPAVGYFFGKAVHDFTHKPVGLIGTCWGGTRAESWMSFDAIKSLPELQAAATQAANFKTNHEHLREVYQREQLPQWQAAMDKWKVDNAPALAAYADSLKQWTEDARQAAAAKRPAPPRPVEPKPPKAPLDPTNDSSIPTVLFNGMVAPFIPFGIKGVAWYQGEANGLHPVLYRTVFPALIKDWRAQWHQGDFPFVFVQFPVWMPRRPQPSESLLAGLREAQTLALALPNTGMAVTIDIGNVENVHPLDKFDVGCRLELAAEHVAYGQRQTGYSGPVYKGLKIEGDKVRVQFDHVDGGLVLGQPPEHYFLAEKLPVPTVGPTELQGFAVAGADGKYVWADASIAGGEVVVSARGVPHPVSVRYAWADSPLCNLYNKDGLPASPFRTDNAPIEH